MEASKLETSKTDFSTFEGAISRLEKASKIVKLDSEAIDRLKHIKYILNVSIPVRMDDGSLRIFNGFRIKHDDKRGPNKGGVRFHPQLNIDELKALSFWMTFKCSLANIPFGGSKGGIIVDIRKLSHLELERLSRGYINQIADFIGPNTDILGPDVNTNAMIMGWMMDEYSIIKRQQTPGVVTGKPIALGGCEGREDATGRGAFYCIQQIDKKYGWQKDKIKIAIQGFGNVGENVAKYLHAAGYKVVALADFQGGIYDENGIDVAALIKKKKELQLSNNVYYQSIADITTYKKISNPELLALDIDVLIPAAIENQITKENAQAVKASIIIEIANGPITPEADLILLDKKVHIFPDILINSGGVIVSYFEWVQNMSGYYWKLDTVNEELKRKILTAFDDVFDAKEKNNIDFRTAAYVCALNRLGQAILAGGTRPYYNN